MVPVVIFFAFIPLIFLKQFSLMILDESSPMYIHSPNFKTRKVDLCILTMKLPVIPKIKMNVIIGWLVVHLII